MRADADWGEVTALPSDRYIREHRAIERAGGELRLAAARRDAGLARLHAAALANELRSHMRAEHQEIQQFVEEAGDRGAQEAAQGHIRHATDTLNAATAFAATWGSAAAICADFDGFRAELDHLLVAIGLGIHDEEKRLFPMIDRLGGALPVGPLVDDEPPTLRLNRADLLRAGVR